MQDPTSPQLLWLQDAPKRPLCDVPWMGNTVVLANGDVNFCCFSDAVVGNVNDTRLREIWNDDTMRRIRRTLRDQTLPPECRSPSCPIFRGDENHIILTRMEGAYSARLAGSDDPHAETRRGFARSRVRRGPPASSDSAPSIALELHYEGVPLCADLYLAVRGGDRVIRFLPRLEEVPFPYLVGVRLPSDLPVSIGWPEKGEVLAWPGEMLDVCGAVFESGSHPNIASNCYWSTTVQLRAEDESPLAGELAGGRNG